MQNKEFARNTRGSVESAFNLVNSIKEGLAALQERQDSTFEFTVKRADDKYVIETNIPLEPAYINTFSLEWRVTSATHDKSGVDSVPITDPLDRMFIDNEKTGWFRRTKNKFKHDTEKPRLMKIIVQEEINGPRAYVAVNPYLADETGSWGSEYQTYKNVRNYGDADGDVLACVSLYAEEKGLVPPTKSAAQKKQESIKAAFNTASSIEKGLAALKPGSKLEFKMEKTGDDYVIDTNIPLRTISTFDDPMERQMQIIVKEDGEVRIGIDPYNYDFKRFTHTAQNASYSGPDAAKQALDSIRRYAQKRKIYSDRWTHLK